MKVTWTPVADTYLPEELRDTFLAEASKSTWLPANGQHAMSPGLALKEVMPMLHGLGLRGVSHVAYSQAWIVRDDTYRPYPDPADPDAPYPSHPDVFGHYTILGVRSEVNKLTFYLLDLGHGIAPIALVDDKEGGR